MRKERQKQAAAENQDQFIEKYYQFRSVPCNPDDSNWPFVRAGTQFAEGAMMALNTVSA